MPVVTIVIVFMAIRYFLTRRLGFQQLSSSSSVLQMRISLSYGL